MKNKSVILITLICVCFICLCGCEKNSKLKEIIEDNNYEFGWGQSNSNGLICEEIGEAISFNGNYFLTSNGELYKFHSSKLFSNDKNCIKTKYSDINLSFIYGQGVYNNEHSLVYILSENEVLTPEEYKNKNGYDYFRSEIIQEDYDFISYNDCESEEIIFIKNNKIYWYDLNNKEKHILGEIPLDENILYLNGALIKTDKAYWRLERTNQDECSKYVDVKCKVAFVKSSLTEIYNEILFATQDILIDSNYYSYGKGSCFMISDNY